MGADEKQKSASRNTIVVTGFGPFGGNEINDSWECVKSLKKAEIEHELGVNLITKHLPVVYATTENEVLQIWDEYHPSLVVHVGVHRDASVKIERTGRKSGYTKLDVTGACPPGEICRVGEETLVSSSINLDAVIKNVDSKGLDLSISDDAGSYLCEYTYYISLTKDAGRAIFVHIPPRSAPVNFEIKTAVLQNIIVAMYRHLTNGD